MKRYTLAIAVLLALIMPAAIACKPMKIGATSSGAAVIYGDPPQDESVHPLGVAVRGKHIGNTVMIAAAAGVGAVTAKAIKAVGGDPLSLTADPCQEEPDPANSDKKIAAWQRTFMHPYVFFDCKAWYQVLRYSQARIKSISTILRCLSRVVTLGQVDALAGGRTKVTWDFPGTGGTHTSAGPGGTATVIYDSDGRIVSAYVKGRWLTCAGIAK